MISKLISLALTQRILMALLSLSLVLGGYWAFEKTPIDAFPDVASTQVKVILKAPGMTPAEVESRLTLPIEQQMLGIPHQVMMRSLSKYAIVDITLDFEEGVDIYWARQQVASRLSDIWGDLPQGISGGLAPMSTPLGDMYMFTIEGGNLSLQERRELLDWTIRPALRPVPGVADVNALGGEVRTYTILPDMQALLAHGLSLDALTDSLEMNNLSHGAGRLNVGEEALVVRSQGQVKSLDDLKKLMVKAPMQDAQGQWQAGVRLSQVAQVQFEGLTRYGGVTANGQGEAVEGLVMALRGANTREVISGIEGVVAKLQGSLPAGVHLEVFYNRGHLIDKALATVSSALLEAVVLVILLLVIFLADLRAALTVALILPLASLMTFILMKFFGLSANLMSLGGLAIAIGMLVDAAVVVVENILTHQSEDKKRLPSLHVIYRATQEVATPVVSGILIIMLVFLPLLTLEGLEGKLFKPVALTIVFALGSALFLSLTLIPLLASVLLKSTHEGETRLMRWLMRGYQQVLDWALVREKRVISVALALLVAAGLVYTQVGKSFMPTMDEGDIILQLEKLPSINLETSLRVDLQVQKAILANVPEVEKIIARAGSDELGMDPMNLNDTDSFLVLKPKETWRMQSKEALVEVIRHVVEEQFPGVNYAFTQPIQMRVDEMLTGARGDLAIKVFGADANELNRLVAEIEAKVSAIEGATDVFSVQNEGARYLSFEYDYAALARYGLTVEQVSRWLKIQLEGLEVGKVYEPSKAIGLMIRAPESVRLSPETLLNQWISLPSGESIPLREVANVRWSEGAVAFSREMGQRFSSVVVNVSGRDLVGFVQEAQQTLADLALPQGYYLEWGGEFENQQRAAARLSYVVPLALVLIFLLLFATFGSSAQAVLVMSNVPFAMIGGIVALWFTGEYLSVPASVGFIALLGIAVLNGLVMVSYFNQLVEKGLPLAEVVVKGALRRLRPVLMTASIAALGLVPLVFASGPGSEIQRPLAIVVIGGLVTSTLLTLVLLPIFYRKLMVYVNKGVANV